ncbi:MAG: transposase [Candidatus Nealsonbacteria bacterium]
MESLFYHSYNRGTDKRKIFIEEGDYFRGVHDLYEFNDSNAVFNLKQRINGRLTSINLNKTRENLLNLFVWCLMPNHYHLFSSPIPDNGLANFHKKFGGGFAKFFNVKYKRNGTLFQGKYKKVQVMDDTQAIQLICYIHSNPLDLWKPDWKEKGLTNLEIQNALRFLEQYRWSSHLDWWGIKNFPSLIDKDFMARFFKNSEEYREFFTNWLSYYAKNIESLKGFKLE